MLDVHEDVQNYMHLTVYIIHFSKKFKKYWKNQKTIKRNSEATQESN